MDPARWQRIESLFDAALDMEPERRDVFLDIECDGDAALRAEVVSLLEAHEKNAADVAIGGAVRDAARVVADAAGAEWIGRRIGPYEVRGVAGRGGMGLVLDAVRADSDFEQRVAIKLVHGIAGPRMRLRFQSERKILAALGHPNIARLIDGGETGDGLPYLVMEYVDGTPIDRYCDEHRLSVRERLDLFRSVCEAVHDAHRHLVVHRDIKPGNILVTDAGVPKLVDFGIAKLLQIEPLPGETPPTATAMRALTPQYASPEQVLGRPVTTASDIYSLGVLLYELLTGHHPYRIDTTQPSEVERIVCEAEPDRPSTAVRRTEENEGEVTITPHTVSVARSVRPDRLRRELSGELDTIVLMAMRKEPSRRYASAEQFSEDIRNFLRGRPVLARADTATYRVSKFVRRNKTLVGSLVGIFAALVAGLAVSVSQHRVAVREQVVAEARTREAEHESYLSAIAAAEASIRMNQISEARGQLARAPVALRGWEWRHLRRRLDRSRRTIDAHTKGVTRIAFAPDGATFLTTSLDGSAALWRTDSGDSVRRWSGLDSGVESGAIDPSGSLVAAGLSDGSVRVFDARTGEQRASFAGEGWAMVAFSPDGKKLAAGFRLGQVSEWRTDTFAPAGQFDNGSHFVCIAYAPDGRTLLTGAADGHVRFWDVRRHRRLFDLDAHPRRVMNLVVSDDGTMFATASMDRTVKVWRMADRSLITDFQGHSATVVGLAFTHDGKYVVSAAGDRQILVWDLATADILQQLRGGGEDAYSVAVSPDDGTIVTGSWAGHVRLWARNADDVRTLRVPELSYMQAQVNHARVSPDGRIVAGAADQMEIDLWDTDSGERLAQMPTERDDFPTRVAFSRDGSLLYAGDAGGHILVFDVASHRERLAFAGHSGAVLGLDTSPDGKFLVSGSADSTIRFWDAKLLAPSGEIRSHHAAVTRVLYGPDGTLASASATGTIRFWDGETRDSLRVLHAGSTKVLDIAFSPDGKWLVSASGDEQVRLFDVVNGTLAGTVGSGRGRVTAVCFTPDGTRIAMGGQDQMLRIVDVATRREVCRLHGHVGRILSLEPWPARDGIVSASLDGTIRLWDAR